MPLRYLSKRRSLQRPPARRNRRRRVFAELLESRRLLAADTSFLDTLPTAEEALFGQVTINEQGREICPAFTLLTASTTAEGESPVQAGAVDVTAAIVQPAGPLAPGAAFTSEISFENLGPNTADGTTLAVTFDAGLTNITWQREIIRAQPAVVDALLLDGTDGLALRGTEQLDLSGFSVSGGGDFNGDGIDDFIIGANEPDIVTTAQDGEAYVVFGTASGFPAAIDLATLDGSAGFSIVGASAGSNLGTSVDSAGDVNGDGKDDLIVGAPGADPAGVNDAGQAFVIFGKSSFGPQLDLATITAGDGFSIAGTGPGSLLGGDVAGAGDLNNDGLGDIVVGASGTDGRGAVVVIFGKDTPFDGVFDLGTLDGSNGYIIATDTAGDDLGFSVDGAGDVNGDGFGDIIVGATKRSDDTGAAYVVFGKASGFAATYNVGSLAAADGFTIGHPRPGHNFGFDVSGLGDVNGDTIDDVIIVDGVEANGTAAARGYVLFGSQTPFGTTVDVSALDGGNGIFVDAPASDHPSQMVVSGGGDLNGDGINDVVVGLPQATDVGTPPVNYDGGGYVLFGSSSPVSPFNLGTVDGNNGFLVQGAGVDDQAGFSIGLAGDVNADGLDDVIVGAPFRTLGTDPNTEFAAGETYVVFGRGSTTADGAGAISDVLDLNPGDRVVYRVSAEIAAGASGATVVNASATLADGNDDLTPANNSASASTDITAATEVVGRHVFYNDSAFDATSDAAAIATDKQPLLPGQTATFDHYTSFSKGINGLIIDVDGLANPGAVGLADFSFKTGNVNDSSTWADAPSPLTVNVLENQGVGGADRIVIIWASNNLDETADPNEAVAAAWLQVNVLATAATGLASADTFYFGNAPGESGAGNTPLFALVNATDEIGARNNSKILPPATIVDVHDFDRNRRVDATDQIIARNNSTVLDALRFITVP